MENNIIYQDEYQIMHEKIFEIIYNIIIEQNKNLLRIIAQKEKIPLKYLQRGYLPSKKEFKDFINNHSFSRSSSYSSLASSSSSSSSSSS